MEKFRSRMRRGLFASSATLGGSSGSQPPGIIGRGRVAKRGGGHRGGRFAAAAAYRPWPNGQQQQQVYQLQHQQSSKQQHPQPQQQQPSQQPPLRHRSQPWLGTGGRLRRHQHQGRRGGGVSATAAPGSQHQLRSSDPLNLRWIAAESQRRQQAGLSPMPGDSALGSPVLPGGGIATDQDEQTASQPQQKQQQTQQPTFKTATVVAASAAATTRRVSGGTSGGGFKPIYGNYRAYYGKRLRVGDLNIGRMQDDRLELLQPDWYLDRDVLDIGCNDGVLSLKIAETLGVRSLTGVDIDGHLVQRAQRNLRLRVREAEAEARVKSSLAMEGFEVQQQQQQQASAGRAGFPYNVFFQTGNYVLDSEDQLAKVEENKYDIIQAFSITKWIHLNWGDRGLKLFFRRAFKELRPDGKLILEPQPFPSYKKKLLCHEHKRNYAAIQLRPEHFRDYLEREVGFAHILSVSEQQQYHGCQRPVLMCTKPTGRTPAQPLLHQPPHQPPHLPPSLQRHQHQQPPLPEADAAAATAMAAASSAVATPESMRLIADDDDQDAAALFDDDNDNNDDNDVEGLEDELAPIDEGAEMEEDG